MTTLIRQIIFIVFGFFTLGCLAQDKLTNEFHLTSKNKTKTIRSKQEIRIISKWRWDYDSTQVDIHPQADSAFRV